jgi:hypothetical protein
VQVPLALRRSPSVLQPPFDGAQPFSYPRLVQPVLDRHCVGCHARHPDKAPRLDAEPLPYRNGRFFASYLSLVPQYAFADYGGKNFSDPKWYRTTPGAFGARASRLWAMLESGHHDVQLPPEDRQRLSLWLDSCSLFYGVYEKEGGEAQLRGEIAQPSLQ